MMRIECNLELSGIVSRARSQLAVILVRPDCSVGNELAGAIAAAGHRAVFVSAAHWAVPLVRAEPPDVVILERSAVRYEVLLEVLESLDVYVPVLVTQFSGTPALRSLNTSMAEALVRRVERAVYWSL